MLLALAVFIAVAIVVVAMISCDRLVTIERDRSPEQWEADGSPIPMLRRHAGTTPDLLRMFATTRCCFTWIFSTPKWARSDPNARRLLLRIRLLLVVWTFAAVPVLVVTFTLSIRAG